MTAREGHRWTAAEREAIRRWVAAGELSLSEMARRLGPWCSKDMVSSQCHRLGLQRPGRSPIKRRGGAVGGFAKKGGAGALAERREKSETRRAAALQAARPGGAADRQRRGLARVELGPMPRRCQWIEGEPGPTDACKCGRAVAAGAQAPYCAAHLARAYVGRTAAERAA